MTEAMVFLMFIGAAAWTGSRKCLKMISELKKENKKLKDEISEWRMLF